ncbi:hypothetical protein IJ182_05525 [bacterium]|nr:hypothetical protein [bacterium]
MPYSIILKEYEKKTLNDINKELNTENAFCNKELLQLEKYLAKNHLSSALKTGADSITAKYWVGVVKFRNFQFEILPKLISEESASKETILNNLVFMLSYTRKLDIKTTDNANLSKTSNPFLEILIREYANSLFDCLKRLTPKNYIREENNLNYIKGKLKFTEDIRYNASNQAKFYCEYDEFSENNILNQLFYFVSNGLYTISKDRKNKTVLKLIINYFQDIDLVNFDSNKCDKIKLSRAQMLFEKPFKLAKMFVEHSSVDLSKNKFENITMLWDMNKLFEEFVYRIIKNKIPEVKAEAQKCKRLLRNNKTTRRDTKVDILITKKSDGTKIILDTKYKKAESLEDIDNADIYQVMTYCLLHDESKENKNSAILLYPQYKQNKKTSIPEYCINSQERQYSLKMSTVNLMHENLKDNNVLNVITKEIKDIIGV